MNPGKLNHRIRFMQEVATPDGNGGSVMTTEPVVCSETTPTDVTWGDLQPIKQWNQAAFEAGLSVENGDKMLIIRYRKNFQPTKSMIFEDLNNPGDTYTVRAISPYQPGSKSTFQNTDQTVYKDQVYVFIMGVKRK